MALHPPVVPNSLVFDALHRALFHLLREHSQLNAHSVGVGPSGTGMSACVG